MAKTVGSQPWVMTATGDYEGHANDGETTKPVFNHSIFIRQIKVDTGDGGNVLISNKSGGVRRLKLDSTPANDTLWVPINAWWDGLYVTTLPTNGSLEIYHGRV